MSTSPVGTPKTAPMAASCYMYSTWTGLIQQQDITPPTLRWQAWCAATKWYWYGHRAGSTGDLKC